MNPDMKAYVDKIKWEMIKLRCLPPKKEGTKMAVDRRPYTVAAAALFRVIRQQFKLVEENGNAEFLYITSWKMIQLMGYFRDTERQRLEEYARQNSLQFACAKINSNLRCYDLCMEISSSTRKLFPRERDEFGLADTCCKGFLDDAKESVHLVVKAIFGYPEIQLLLEKLFQGDWLNGETTKSLLSAFGVHFDEVKSYLGAEEEGLFKQFVEGFLEETIVVYVNHLLVQTKCIQEGTTERMKIDEEPIMNFFGRYISASKVAKRAWILVHLRKLASSSTPESFTRVYATILEDHPDCRPEVVERIIGLSGILSKKNSQKVFRKCKEIYESCRNSPNPKVGFLFPLLKGTI